MTSAAAVSALCRAYSGMPPSERHLRALLSALAEDEDVLWCGVYPDQARGAGGQGLLAVTTRRLISQHGDAGPARGILAREIALGEIVEAMRVRSPAWLGLRTRELLLVRTASQSVVWDRFDAEQCAGIIAALRLASTG